MDFALPAQQNITAEQYAQYEGAVSASMGELRTELRAAVTTAQQQQRQLEALSTHSAAAQTEFQRVAHHRGQMERHFAELYQAAMLHDEHRAQDLGAALSQQEGAVVGVVNSAPERQKAVADAVFSNMRSENGVQPCTTSR